MNFIIVLTEKCNLRCRYCYEKNKNHTSMNIEIAKKCVNFVKKCMESEKNILRKEHNVVFHGGEPLLEYEILEYIVNEFNKVKDFSINYFMTTNATIYEDKIANFVASNNINLSVSIDGNKKSHDLNRIFENGNGSYDLVIENMKKYTRKIKNIRCRITFTKDTLGDIYLGILELYKIGLKIFAVSENIYCKEWEDDSLEILSKQIKKLSGLKKMDSDVKISLLDFKEEFEREKGDCFGGITGMAISSNGSIYPCIYNMNDENFYLGNLESEMVEIKNSAFYIHRCMSELRSECDDCDLNKFCDARRCKLLNFAVNRDSRKANPMTCELTKMKWKLYKEEYWI
ncbi:4Fe-4S cluster-binding domain-containing protein [Peptostreptococcus anaerobius]|nr:radical SAM protein [Peptostreptococcus anaerobius]MCB6983491.1 4Fe-4S cluster-binding domain-containing protein [Peptostreptococcus anaerobius]MCQ5150025.1 4Fe-4S cluster-binding domain-containing protein [Peptostreptococcus anaerobius]CCY47920.1 radical SAM domain protein [Peptostreptococcus anaerobius CAG:621]